jgi:hypothetical protein
MQGGITGGVLDPGAIDRLLHHIRFKDIGGRNPAPPQRQPYRRLFNALVPALKSGSTNQRILAMVTGAIRSQRR